MTETTQKKVKPQYSMFDEDTLGVFGQYGSVKEDTTVIGFQREYPNSKATILLGLEGTVIIKLGDDRTTVFENYFPEDSLNNASICNMKVYEDGRQELSIKVTPKTGEEFSTVRKYSGSGKFDLAKIPKLSGLVENMVKKHYL